MDISLIVINFNYDKFIEKCIQSCIDQDLKPCEIIVIDDGSTDSSKSKIQSFGDSVKAIYKQNMGHVEAVNTGFIQSRGDICVFIDADDYLYPHCVSEISKLWTRSASKMQYRLDTVDKIGVNQNMPFPNFPTNLSSVEIRRQAREFGVYPWTVSTGNAYARKFLERVLPADSQAIYRSPDGYLNKLAPLFGDVLCSRTILGAYRVHGQNTWAQDGQRFSVAPIVRWLRFDLVLQRRFVEIAHELGEPVQNNAIRSFQQLEHLALCRRFAPDLNPSVIKKNRHIFAGVVIGLIRFPNVSMIGKLAWAIWVAAILALPLPIVNAILLSGRGQSGRTRLMRLIVKISQPTK